jgi:hypothetical protein
LRTGQGENGELCSWRISNVISRFIELVTFIIDFSFEGGLKCRSNGFDILTGEGMDLKCKWLMALLLPLVASCSSPLGIVKKTPELKPKTQLAAKPSGQATEIAKKEDGAFHIVGPGETLRHICDVYGLELGKVAKVNKILPTQALKEGEAIFLPVQALLEDSDPWNHSAGSRGKPATPKLTKKRACSLLASVMRGHRDPKVPALRFPVKGGILSSPFGHRWGRFHRGLDIAAPVGRQVLACAKGRVVFTGTRKRFRRYGNTVLIASQPHLG